MSCRALVSIIIPIYNSSKYIRKCVESVLCQSYENLEIILVNDGSTDDSLSIAESYAEIDGRVKIISQQNAGLGAARNHGMDVATGDFALFVDSDDFLTQAYAVERLVKEAVDSRSDLIVFGYELSFQRRDAKKKHVTDDISSMFVGSWNKMYSRRIFTSLRFAEDCYFEDAAFVLLSMVMANNVLVVDESLYAYVQRQGSITSINTDYLRHLDVIRVLSVILTSPIFLGADAVTQQDVRVAMNYQIVTHIVVMLDNIPLGEVEQKELLDKFVDFQKEIFPDEVFVFSRRRVLNFIWGFVYKTIIRNPISIRSRTLVGLINKARSGWRQ